MHASQAVVQHQMQALLAQLQMPTQPPPTTFQAPLPPTTHPAEPPVPPVPIQMAPTPQVPPGPSAPMGSNTALLLGANLASRSLASYFPEMKPMLLLVISKHNFYPGQLFKIVPQMKD